MTTANHVAAIAAVMAGAYATHVWWPEIRQSTGFGPTIEARDAAPRPNANGDSR